MKDIKREVKARARLLRGLANVFQLDADYIWSDSSRYDAMCLNESVQEAKITLQQITDSLTELEYLLYLIRREESK